MTELIYFDLECLNWTWMNKGMNSSSNHSKAKVFKTLQTP